MAKFCPACKAQIELNALSCRCGHIFVDDIELTQSVQLEHVQHLRKDRIIKRTVILTCCGALVLTFAAWVGGFISTSPVVADSDVSQVSNASRPLPEVPQPPTGPLMPRFPENGVPYTAVKAVTGSVFEVTDAAGQAHRVAIHGIRVPKLDENFGHESRASLSTSVLGKPVMIKLRKFTKDVDTIAEVYTDGLNIGLEQVRNGMAWLVPEDIAGLSESEQRDYLDAAVAAKSGKHGIWSGKKGVNPLTGEPGDWNAPKLSIDAPGDAVDTQIVRSHELPKKQNFTPGRRNDRSNSLDQVPMVESFTVPVEVEKPPVKEEPSTPPARPKPVPSSGRTYIRGPFGGCYYINSNGNKSYVDRSACN